MALFFISGVPGTGKTALMKELRVRGEEAHDADDECVMISKKTGAIVDYDSRKDDPYDWIYPTESLRKLKAQAASKHVFLLGSVDNFDEVNDAADKYIWLDIPLDILLQRLDARRKDYGKSASERQSIIELYTELKASLGPKLLRLDATKPVDQIADELLLYAKSFLDGAA